VRGQSHENGHAMRSSQEHSTAAADPFDVDVGVVYTYEREWMNRLLSTLAGSAHGVRMRVVLVDNHSGEDLGRWKQYVAPTIVEKNPRRLSYAANMNRVLRVSSARYVLLLNTDMFFDPHNQCLGRMVRFMDRHPGCGVAGCRLYRGDGQFAYPARRFQTLPAILGRRLGLERLTARALDDYLYRNRSPEDSWECDWLSGCFLMLRREAFEDVGFFDEGFVKYFEDVDMCYRMARSGWKVMYHGGAYGYHLERRASLNLFTRDAARHLRSYLRWHWKWGFSYSADLPRPAAA